MVKKASGRTPPHIETLEDKSSKHVGEVYAAQEDNSILLFLVWH